MTLIFDIDSTFDIKHTKIWNNYNSIKYLNSLKMINTAFLFFIIRNLIIIIFNIIISFFTVT
jgi:hypothetical protein